MTISRIILLPLICMVIIGCGKWGQNVAGVLLSPILVPVGMAANALRTKPYVNKQYKVSDECAKDIVRAIVKDTGVQANDYAVIQIQGLSTQLIREQSNTDSASVGMNTNKGPDTISIESKVGEFNYFFSANSEHLILVLSSFKKSESYQNYSNSFKGYNKHNLTHCKI